MAVRPAIPDEVMVAACNATLQEFPGRCCDNWGEKEKAICRDKCGEKYALVETDWIGKRAINLRKKSLLISVNGGAKRKKWREPEGEYGEYLRSEHWQSFRVKVLDFWEHRCCLCKAKATDVHHNTYIRRGQEELTDCVALCGKCHKQVHGRMADGNSIFNEEPDDPTQLF